MKSRVKTELGYAVPEMFADEDMALSYLEDCGIAKPKKSIGKLYYFLNYLRVEGHLNKFRYNDKNDGWIETKIGIIQTLFGNKKYFYAITDKLLADGLIEVNNSYSVGNYCKSFRLTDTINTDTWKVIKMQATKCTTTKKVLEFTRKDWEPIDHKMFNLLSQLWIDEIPFFDETNASNFKSYKCDLLTKLIAKEEKGKNIEDLYNFYKDSYESIKYDAWRYKVDRNGRRHTNLTNLPKLLKPYLFIISKGVKKRLHTVDVCNSQVHLLLTILPKNIEGYQKFKEWVENDFYQKFADAMNVKLTVENRTEIKQNYFTFIYGENLRWYVWGSAAYKVMFKEFPTIVNFVNNLKNEHALKVGTNHGYKLPACLMQQEESNIIINGVCKELSRQSIFFSQIYDSIMCLEEDIPQVMKIMLAAFKHKGLNVNLKTE